MKRVDLFATPPVQGFKAVVPLWLAAAPVAVAYVVAARQAGMHALEIQLMSLTVYSAAAQIAIVQLVSSGAAIWTVGITVVAMNVHQAVYGLSLTKYIDFARFEKLIAAFGLTDATYGVTIALTGNRNLRFLLGAEFSMYLAWNLFTAVGLLAGDKFAVLNMLPLDLVVPLTFLVLLSGIIESRTDLTVVIFSAALAAIFTAIGVGQLTVVLVIISGTVLGFGITEARKVSR